MAQTGRSYFVAVIALSALTTLSSAAVAGLSGQPQSHVKPLADGEHMLVFLSPAPLADDKGNEATLPDGRQVKLREEFPASGCYKIGSNVPLWTAPWDDRDGWVVSKDCRYLIRCNVFGDGNYNYQNSGRLSWALKFYDMGREIKSYQTGDLLDYPSLMPYTSSDWHFLWYDEDDAENFSIRSGRLFVRTSTHDRFEFDIANGNIVAEHHLWRSLARGAVLGLIGIVATATVFLLRRRARAVIRPSDCGVNPATNDDPRQVITTGYGYSFSLRTLLIFVTVAAAMCGLWTLWPHVAVFIGSIVVAIVLSRFAFRQLHPRGRSRGWRFVVLVPVVTVAWLWIYLLSVGPVLGLLHRLDAGDDVRSVVICTAYRPLVYLDKHIPLNRWHWLDSYVDAWT